jgi:hypothetical protein
MRFLTSAIAVAALGCVATAALAADIPDYIGGAEVPASASRGMLEGLGFTDLDATPEQKGNLLYTTGKWEGRDVELEVNLETGVIRVLKEGS